MSLSDNYRKLQTEVARLAPVAIAFSGGVDSTLLLKVACDVAGADQVLALTATSPIFPRHELAWCQQFTRQLGVRHIIFPGDELELAGFVENGPQRCYHCKRNLYRNFLNAVEPYGAPTLLDGSNLDDLSDYRPGHQAIRELDIKTPLLTAGLSKEQVRTLSHQLDLPTWNKQAFACLATRFPYGTRITREKLEQIGHCEDWFYHRKFSNYRVRAHDNLARIEVSTEDISRLFAENLTEELVSVCKSNGFDYVTLDLQGFRSGSMDECLPVKGQKTGSC
ncbi:MAG: ATP-dependent sacrificial sulfur transferase LarE [Pelovirga sp.]